MNYISSITNPHPGKFIVCKSPIEDCNNNSILTVNPGEQAIFVNNGTIAGIFENGRYELSTQNYPFLNAFRRFLANGNLTYHCTIFFVSDTQSPEILWGMSLPVRDPVQQIFTKIFVRGSYTLRVIDGAKLLVSLMGMNINFMGPSDIKAYYGNKFQQLISNAIAKYIAASNREVLEMCADNLSISEAIQPTLNIPLSEFGLELTNFTISAMDIDANDPNRRILEMAYARQREVEILGANYGMIKDTDVRINASQTSFAGMSFGAPYPSTVQQHAREYHNHQPNADNVGTTSDDPIRKLHQLSELLEKGLISREEFDNAKAQILSKMI